MQRTVCIPNFRHAILIPKLCIAFFSGHQIKLFHDRIVLSVLRIKHTTHSFYHEHQDGAIDACAKKHPDFSDSACIDTPQKRFAETRSLHRNGADQKGFGIFPTSILNLIFVNQIQKSQAGTSLHCLPQQCVRSVRIQPLVALS